MQSTKTIIITTAILTLMILGAGCTDTGGANPETTTYTLPPEDVSVVSTPETPAVEVIPEPIVEPITEPVETPWYIDKYGFEDADVSTYSNMFGEDIYAVKSASLSGLSYNLFDTQTEGLHILSHQEWTPSMIALYNELSPDQYKELVADYGSMNSLTMETIDLDRDGTMDKVAVIYNGGPEKGGFIHESKYIEGESVKGYISDKLFFDRTGKHVYDVYDM